MQLARVREVVSGGREAACQQLDDELDKEGRQKLLCSKEFSVALTTEESLAMKTNLVLPWKKLRVMRRYSTCTCISVCNIKNVLRKTYRWFKARGGNSKREEAAQAFTGDDRRQP